MTERLLIVGSNGHEGQIGGMFARAAEACGLPVQLIDARTDLTATLFDRVAFRLRRRRHPGEAALNRRVLSAASTFKPTIMLVTGLMPVHRATIEEIRHRTAVAVNYMTDDPFNRVHRSPTALASISAFDLFVSLKPLVDGDLRSAGARRICRSWFAYDPTQHFPERAPAAEMRTWAADITFVGGADRDRASLLAPARRWAREHGRSFAVFGGRWNRFPRYLPYYRGFANGPHYRHALTEAGVLLSPVRRANRDGHTMRTFEAPAIGAFMLLERTADHLELFEEDRHAAFFSGPEELRDKSAFYVSRDTVRRRIAEAAHTRITTGGHTYAHRLQQILAWVSPHR